MTISEVVACRNSSSPTTQNPTLATGAAVSVGDIIALIASFNNLDTLSTLTNPAGDTYTRRANPVGTSNLHLEIWDCKSSQSGIITTTFPFSTAAPRGLWLIVITGTDQVAWFDKTAQASGSGSPLSSGNTPTLSQANEYVLAAFGASANVTFTAGSGYTIIGTPGARNMHEGKIVSATTALPGDATCTGTPNWVAAVVTYKEASGGGSDQNVSPSGIAALNAFGTPTVTLGGADQNLSPSGIAPLNAFGTPIVAVDQSISPSGIAPAGGFGTPTVTVNQVIQPLGVDPITAFGQPTVSPGPAALAPATIGPAPAVAPLVISVPASGISPARISPTASIATLGLTPATVSLNLASIPPSPTIGSLSLTPGAGAIAPASIPPASNPRSLALAPGPVGLSLGLILPPGTISPITAAQGAATLAPATIPPRATVRDIASSLGPAAISLQTIAQTGRPNAIIISFPGRPSATATDRAATSATATDS